MDADETLKTGGPEPTPDETPTEVVAAPVTPEATAQPMAAREAAPPAAPAMDASHVSDAPSEPLSPVTLHAVTPPPGPRRSSARWLGAGVLIAAIAVISVAVFAVLAGGSSTSWTAAYVPKESVVFMTMRTDLPGDQRAKVADFLAHFPGFKDQSLFDQKVSEALDKAIAEASPDAGSSVYSGQLKSWLGNEISVAMTRMPNVSALVGASSGSSMSSDEMQAAAQKAMPGELLLIQTKDPAGAKAWLQKVAGSPVKTETYDGVTISLYGSSAAPTVGWAMSGDILIAGDVASVKAGLDAHGSTGSIDGTAAYKSARAALSGDRVGFGFINVKSYLTGIRAALPSAAGLGDLTSMGGGWAGFALRFESNAIVFDAAGEQAPGSLSQTNRTSTLATQLPSTVVAELEYHDVGAAVKHALDTYANLPGYKSQIDALNTALDRVGGFNNVIGWMNDASIVVTSDGKTLSGGLVVTAKDAATASKEVTQVQNLLTLAGMGGSSITSHEETYAGSTITVLDLGPMGSSSSMITGNTSGHFEIAFTAHDNLVIAGVGDAFVKSVIDVKSGSSLADAPRYKTAMDLAGTSNVAQFYLDVTAIRGLVEANAPASSLPDYEANVKPYLVPFQSIAGSMSFGNPSEARSVVIVQ